MAHIQWYDEVELYDTPMGAAADCPRCGVVVREVAFDKHDEEHERLDKALSRPV